MNELDIFSEAIELKSPEARRRFLDEACQGDERLRERLETLLGSAAEDSRFMESFPDSLLATIDQPDVIEKPGTMIGPYKLREKIGDGGFGVVYVAEQTEPVRREVALKIIKPGMDSRDVIARFEAERQALALMDHPNITRVLDAGTTASGRPYFVMELVKGVPITEFCDAEKLPTRRRLELFVQVCRAVQHAHQKGIIHRDLKPSNVMVTRHDATPVPKVIDFGVSKAITRELTENTVYTAYGQLIGTPLYMSPEQAQLNGLDVDTRSDVYSLGVLLYELLTGTTPFDKETLRNAGFDELCRIIREDDPLRPSARISTLKAEALSTISDHRRIDSHKLTQCLRGELDWIVMKALEKDRDRRYESAAGLARDVERYFHDEPIEARPPSAWYRFVKFARRNRRALATMALIICGVATAYGGVLMGVRVKQERRRTKVAVSEAAQRRKVFDAVVEQEHAASVALMNLAKTYAATQQYEPAEDILRLAVRINENLATESDSLTDIEKRVDLQHGLEFAYLQLGNVQRNAGKLGPAVENYRQAMARAEVLKAGFPDRADFAEELRDAQFGLARCLLKLCEGSSPPKKEYLWEAERLLLDLTDSNNHAPAPRASTDRHTVETQAQLGWCLYQLGRSLLRHGGDTQRAAIAIQRANATFEELPAGIRQGQAFRERLCLAYGNLSGAYSDIGQFSQAAKTALKAFEVKDSLIADFPDEAIYQRWTPHARIANEIARRLLYGVTDPSAADYELALRLARILPRHRDDFGPYHATLGMALFRTEQYVAALETLQRAASGALDSDDKIRVRFFLAMTHSQLGDFDAADAVYQQGVASMKEHVQAADDLPQLQAEAGQFLGRLKPTAELNNADGAPSLIHEPGINTTTDHKKLGQNKTGR